MFKMIMGMSFFTTIKQAKGTETFEWDEVSFSKGYNMDMKGHDFQNSYSRDFVEVISCIFKQFIRYGMWDNGFVVFEPTSCCLDFFKCYGCAKEPVLP